MLSQYSWWDFIKVVLVGLAVYYAYVAWVYYREDIREWLNGRGEKGDPKAETPDAPEEEDSSSLYAVNHYTPAGMASTDNTVTPVSQYRASSGIQPAPVSEVNLTGVAINQEMPETTGFSLPILVESKRPTEQSLSTLLNAAQRLQADSDGVMVADDPADAEAMNLAQIINQQQGRSALAGILFNR